MIKKIIIYIILLALVCSCQTNDKRSQALNRTMPDSYQFIDDPYMQTLLDSGWITQDIHDMIYDYPLCEKTYAKAVQKAESILDSIKHNGKPEIVMPFSLPTPCTKEDLFMFLKYDAEIQDYWLKPETSSYYKEPWELLLENYKDIYAKEYEISFTIFQDTVIYISLTTTGPVCDAMKVRYGQIVMSSFDHDIHIDYNKDTTTFDKNYFYWQNDDFVISVFEDIMWNSRVSGNWWSRSYKGKHYASTISYQYRPGYASYRKKYHDLRVEYNIRRQKEEKAKRLREEKALQEAKQKQYNDSANRVNNLMKNL